MTHRRSALTLAVAGLTLGLSGCAWWEDVTGQTQTSSVVPAQGAANFDNMISAIGNQPAETRRLADMGNVSADKVIIANANMMAPGSSARQLDNAMHNNARSITALRKDISGNPSLRHVLAQRGVPVNNVVALDVTSGGGVVVYALPPVQTGQLPTNLGPSNQTTNAPGNAPANNPPNSATNNQPGNSGNYGAPGNNTGGQ